MFQAVPQDFEPLLPGAAHGLHAAKQEQVLEILRNPTTNPPDKVKAFSFKGAGGSYAKLFDLGTIGNKNRVRWTSPQGQGGSAAFSDVVRGVGTGLPVGSGVENCVCAISVRQAASGFFDGSSRKANNIVRGQSSLTLAA